MITKWNPFRAAAGLLLAALCFGLAVCAMASAGTYVVAQCSPGVYPGVDDAGFSASTTHYASRVDCSPSAPGLQIEHRLFTGETGTAQGAYGAWVWQAPAGTYITGGSTYSRLAAEDGQHGYLAVSPDAGASVSYENQNDDQGHEAGIPPGNWRYLLARLQCTQPNEGNRCVGQCESSSPTSPARVSRSAAPSSRELSCAAPRAWMCPQATSARESTQCRSPSTASRPAAMISRRAVTNCRAA